MKRLTDLTGISESLLDEVAGDAEQRRQGQQRERIAPNLDTALLDRLRDLKPEKYHYSDRGTSALFADCFRHFLRYDSTAREWRHYNGIVWELDVGGMRAALLAKAFFDALMYYAFSIEDESAQTAYRKYYNAFGGKGRRETLLQDARAEMFFTAEMLDSNLNLLNVRNGTIELDTLTFREHCADDLLTKCCGAEYHPEIRSELWERFVRDVIPNDLDKMEYLQKAIGYSLTGTPLESFFILYGRTTRNGKSTLLETVAAALGDYALTASPETIAAKKRDSRAPSEDIARLCGCRFLTLPEPKQGMILDIALLKQLTGGDTITARFLNQGSFQFRPAFTLFMNTNFLPRCLDETLFSSDRVHVIEFQRHFRPEEQDKRLKDKLRSAEKQSAVLNWLLDGLRMYREQGLHAAYSVELETADYRRVSDKLHLFLDECFEPNDRAVLPAKSMYETYKSWCSHSGYCYEGKKAFYEKLRTKGLLHDTGTLDGKTAFNVVTGYEPISESNVI